MLGVQSIPFIVNEVIVNGFLRTDRSFIVKLNTFIVNKHLSEHFLVDYKRGSPVLKRGDATVSNC